MLGHFLAAQAPVYPAVLAELRAAEKRTHWMWFIFPQLQGLGRSAIARRFGLRDLAAAQDYLAHTVLGDRLRECTALVLAAVPRSAHQIFGSPDDLKFHSSMTLFARADPGGPLFREALDRFYGGRGDPLTEQLLAATPPAPPS